MMGKHVFYDFSAITYVEKDDPTYGTFKMQCVGIVDYLGLLKTLPTSTKLAWFDGYHPLTYFRLAAINQFDLHSHVGYEEGCERVAVFVPTNNGNKDWDFHGCKYGRDVGGSKRPFPIGASEAKIAKWQNSLPDRILVPEWLDECKSFEDLVLRDQMANTPCQFCRSGASAAPLMSEKAQS